MPTLITDTGYPAVLDAAMDMPTDRFGWTDFQWEAVARQRYCHAYCDHTSPIGLAVHAPGCAYATDRWILRAIAMLRQVNRGW